MPEMRGIGLSERFFVWARVGLSCRKVCWPSYFPNSNTFSRIDDRAMTKSRWKHISKKRLGAIVIIVVVVGLGVAFRAEVANWQAQREISSRRLDRAYWWLSLAKRVAPHNSETEFLLGRVARKRADVETMKQHLERAKMLGFSADRIQRETWLADAQSGVSTEAEQRLALLFKDQQGDGNEICEAYTMGYIKNHRIGDAEKLLQAWREAYPKDPQPFLLAAYLQIDLQDWKEAEANLHEALNRNPDHGPSHYGMAVILLRQKRPQEALEHYRAARKDSTIELDARIGMAKCLRSLGETEQARQELEKVLKFDPSHIEAVELLSLVYLDNGEYQAAYDLLRPVAPHAPRNWRLRHTFATALRGVGKRDEAKAEFALVEQAEAELAKASRLALEVRSHPENLKLRHEIANIYAKYGEESEAAKWYWSILDLAPNDAVAKKGLAELAENVRPQSGIAQ